MPTSPDDFQTARNLVARAGLVAMAREYLDKGVGRPRRDDLYGFFVAFLVNALHDSHTAELTSITKVLNGFTPSQRTTVGLEDWTIEHSYDRVTRLFHALAPEDTIVGADPSVLDAFAEKISAAIISASIPRRHRTSTSVAIDGTDVETWARCHFREVALDGEEGPSEAEAQYRARPRKAALESFGLGPDGRHLYTKAPTARTGYRSATNSRPAGFYNGHELHVMAMTREATIHDPARRVSLGPDQPRLIRAAYLTEAGADRALVCRRLVKVADRSDWRIRDVIADRGMTLGVHKWQLPLRAEGYVPFFDLHTNQTGVQPSRHGFLAVDGWPHTRALPPTIGGCKSTNLPRPPMGASSERKAPYIQRFTDRATSYSWRVHQGPDEDGAMRFIDPFRSKRLRSPGMPASMRLDQNKPLVQLPADWSDADHGIVTVQAADLPLFQPVIYGTPAWHAGYLGRRQVVESANSGLTKMGIGTRGHFKVFGRAKLTILLAAEIAAFNVRTIESFERANPAPCATVSTRATQRQGTYSEILRNTAEADERRRSKGPP